MYSNCRTATDQKAGAAAASSANDATASATKGDFSVAKLPTVGHRWICKRIGLKYSTGDTVQPATQANLLDSTTGAGNKLNSWEIGIGLSTLLNGVNCVNIDENDLFQCGVVNQAMTLEYASNGAANTTSSLFLQGFADVPD